jgi:hypothetical protein
LAILAWLLPVAGIGYYQFSKGAAGVLLEKADRLQRQAAAKEKAGGWGEAAKLYDEALAIIPADGYKLERAGVGGRAARAKLRDGEIRPALMGFRGALAELPPGPKSAALERDLRYSLAEAEYYEAWILRLENQPRAKWFPHAAAARQNLRFLAENPALPATERNGHARDMEAVIRLTRLDIEELKKLPTPPNKGSGDGPEAEGPPGPPGPPKKPGKKPAKGAGPGERPPGIGS